MQKNMKVIETILISNPEASLEQDNLTYQSAEVQDIINNFTSAANFTDVHKFVLELLQATANFRYATVPNGIFFTVRNKQKSTAELAALFSKMEQSLLATEMKFNFPKLSSKDKDILRAAVKYACHSIKERMQSLQPEDKLLPLWQQSNLKKLVEQHC